VQLGETVVDAGGTHRPTQAPDGQTVPQALQLEGSLSTSTHTPAQQTPSTVPLNAQATPVAPDAQVAGAHPAPSSLSTVPERQVTEPPAQLPLVHVSPIGHIAPHAPQLLGSESKP